MKTCKGTKTVKGCGEEKPIEEFKIFPRCISNMCRACNSKHKRERYAKKKVIDNIASIRW